MFSVKRSNFSRTDRSYELVIKGPCLMRFYKVAFASSTIKSCGCTHGSMSAKGLLRARALRRHFLEPLRRGSPLHVATNYIPHRDSATFHTRGALVGNEVGKRLRLEKFRRQFLHCSCYCAIACLFFFNRKCWSFCASLPLNAACFMQ